MQPTLSRFWYSVDISTECWSIYRLLVSADATYSKHDPVSIGFGKYPTDWLQVPRDTFPMPEVPPTCKIPAPKISHLMTCLTSCIPVVILDHWYLIFNLHHSVLYQAKLRYDPIELDPEDMCRMASEQPQVRMDMVYKRAILWVAHLENVSQFFHFLPLVICLYLP